MVGIKICGIRDVATVQLCVDLNIEWIGLVFYPPSPRYISEVETREIADFYNAKSLKKPKRVGLFVHASDEEIAKALSLIDLDILQIYDDAERVHDIRAKFGLPVWQSRGVSCEEDLPKKMICDGFVIEAKPKPEDCLPGGMGRIFDWKYTYSWNAPGFWMLAGGLTPDNVAQAITTSSALAVDVSSGVEERKGFKSHVLIKKFVENVRKPLAQVKGLQ